MVDDGSTDDTAEKATAAGARVVRREPGGSKAHAMKAAVEATDADAVLFVDADLLGLRSHRLDEICRPFVEGRAVMSIGTFDYGLWNPWCCGCRRRPVSASSPSGCSTPCPRRSSTATPSRSCSTRWWPRAGCPPTAPVMHGVTHRTKREKFGPVEGWRRTWRMFWQLVGLVRVVRLRTYWFYLRGLTIER